MAASRDLPARPSLESIRKQAKKLARNSARSLSLRDAQLALAREYGFAGWRDLVAEVMQRTDRGLELAAREAERVIHDNDTDRLRQLLAEHPGLVSWREPKGRSLLREATGSFGDSGDPFREQMFTRLACAEILIDAGVEVDERVLRNVIRARAHNMLQMLDRKHAVPHTLEYLAALGDLDAIRRLVDGPDAPERDGATLDRAFMNACRFQHRDVAAFLLDRSIELNPEFGARIESGPGRAGFIERMCELRDEYGSPWQTFVMDEILKAVERADCAEFDRWLTREPYLLGPQAIDLQVQMIERGSYGFNDRAPMILALFAQTPPSSGPGRRRPKRSTTRSSTATPTCFRC